MGMSSVQYVYVMKGVTKAYHGSRPLLEDISLSFLPGAKIGRSSLRCAWTGRDGTRSMCSISKSGIRRRWSYSGSRQVARAA